MVARDGADWQQASQLWISDGKQDCRGTVQVRLWLDEVDAAPRLTMEAPSAAESIVATRITHKENHHD